jgi:hypothetical protein
MSAICWFASAESSLQNDGEPAAGFQPTPRSTLFNPASRWFRFSAAGPPDYEM